MNNVIAKNRKDIEKYRDKIFKAKGACRKAFAKLPFEEKLRISNNLYKFGVKFKRLKTRNKKLSKADKYKLIVPFLIFIFSLASTRQAYADKGMISLSIPNISIYESGQKAIIGWNGKKELMILTVDAYADTTSKILEILPLPSEPDVREGSMESFKAVQKLILKHSPKRGIRGKGLLSEEREAVEIIFHKKIGAHNLTCVKALRYEEFVEWVHKFLQSSGDRKSVCRERV